MKIPNPKFIFCISAIVFAVVTFCFISSDDSFVDEREDVSQRVFPIGTIRSMHYAENDIFVPNWGDSEESLPKVGDVLQVEFFKDKAVDITVGAAKVVSLNGKSGAIVRGKTLAGKGLFDATYIVYAGRSRVVFDDFTNNKTFELTYDYAQNSYVAIETEKPHMNCATCAAMEFSKVSADSAKIPVATLDAPMSASLLSKTHVIDYMMVFDTASTAVAGGADGITTRALSIIGNMNNCFSNTKIDSAGKSIDAEYNLVKTMTLNSGFTDLEAAITGLRNSIEVRNARAGCNADLVGFIVMPTAGGSTSGLATLGADRSSAFSAATYYSAESTYTAAHEAAHNFGCEHSRDQLGAEGTHAYAVGANVSPYCTIMSYGKEGADIRVPVFSGPYSVYDGVTMGSTTMDNARMLTEQIPAGTAFDGGADLSLDVKSWNSSAAVETKNVTVSLTESAANSFWKVETTAEWLSFRDISYTGTVNTSLGKDGNPIETIEADEGKGSGSFVIETSENASTSPRSAEIRVSIIGRDNNTFEKILEFTRVITVTQAAGAQLEYSLSETRKEIRIFDSAVPLSWMSAGTLPRVGDTIAVQFFDDVSYNLTAAFSETILAGTKPALLVHARTALCAPINASYIICDGKIRVDVRDFDRNIHYTLAWDSDQNAYIARTFGAGENSTSVTPSGVASSVNNLSAATVFDWMAVYDTRGAASANLLGGVQMNSLATYATLNAALVNSVVYDKRFRYVGAFASTTYTANDTGTSAAGPNAFSKALADIESGSTLADEVDDLRMKNGADLVSLLIDPEARSVGGLSNLGPSSLSVNSDFSVVRTAEAVWALTAIHEIGHNFGMGHNATDHGREAYAFGAIATPYHSIMSYGAGTNRVPFFSGADSVCNGVALTQTSGGNASNNVLMLGMSAASVATHLVPATTACPDSPEATPLGAQGSTQTASEGTLSLSISTNTIATSVGAWTISDAPSWMSFDKISGTGTGTVTLLFTENTTGHARTGTFVFSAKINDSEEYSTFLYTLTQDSVRTNLWVDGVTVNDSDWKTTDNNGSLLKNSVDENISTVPTSWRNMLGGEITFFNQNGWYDVNKYTMNPTATHSDSNMCWAVSAANLVQWWLDRNKNFISDFDSIPSGYSTLNSARGGEYHTSKIYDDFCANFENVNGAKAIYGIWWYMSGLVHADVPYRDAVVSLDGAETYTTRGGYLASRMTLKSGATNVGNVLDNLVARIDYDDSGTVAERAGYYEKFSSDLVAAIRAKKGIMISIPGHALTVWGAEFDGDGNATALYISDSDNNAYYGIVKYAVSKGASGEFAGYAILDYEGLENQAVGTLMTLDQGEGLFEPIVPAVSDTADFTNFAGKEQVDFGDFTGVSSGGYGNYAGFSISTGAFAEKGGNWGTSAYLTSITIARAGGGNGSTPLYFNVYTTSTPSEASFVGQASTTVVSGGTLTNSNAAEFVTADFSGLQLNENTTYYVFFSTVVSSDVYAFTSGKLRIRLGKTNDGLTGSNVVYSNTNGGIQGNSWMPIYSLAFSAVETLMLNVQFNEWVDSAGRFPSDIPATEKALDATPAKDEIINLEKFVFDATGTLDPTKPSGAFGTAEILTTGAGTVDEKDYFILRFPYNSAAGAVTLSAECLEILNDETPAWTSAFDKILLEKTESEIVVTLQTPISEGASKQAVRLKGTLDGKTFTTEPYGYELIPISASTTTKFGLRVHKPFIFQKEISIGTTDLPFEVGTETNIDKVKFTDADLFAKIETGKSYIVEILTNGEVEGKRVSAPFIVNRSAWRGFDNTVKDEVAKTVTFDCANLADYLRVLTNVNAVVGYRIREASTLLDVFGPAAGSNLKAGTSRTADIVKYHILDKNLWSFYVDSGNKWNSGSLKGENVTTGNAPIFYHRPIQVQRRGTSDISYILTGEVLTEEQKVHVYKSDANISSGLLFGDSETISKPESESDVQINSKL